MSSVPVSADETFTTLPPVADPVPQESIDAPNTGDENEPSYANPFRSTKSPITGRWHDPKFSLRRQAEIVRLARAHGVEELLPFTVKGT